MGIDHEMGIAYVMQLRKDKVIGMIKNKMIMIEDFNKNECKNFRMDAIRKLTENRRLQFEKTKILFIEYETKQ